MMQAAYEEEQARRLAILDAKLRRALGTDPRDTAACTRAERDLKRAWEAYDAWMLQAGSEA